MLKLLQTALCALLLSSCILLPVTESPFSRAQAERIVRFAYGETTEDLSRDVQSLAYFFDVIAEQYYRKINVKDLADTAIDYLSSTEQSTSKARLQGARKAILAALDRHSQFFTSEEFTAFKQHLNGEFVGVGVRIRTHAMGAVAEPLPGSPAILAGMRKGDIIVRAGNKSFKGMSLQAIVETLRGKVGTSVSIAVIRNYQTPEQQNLAFSLRRKIIQQVFVTAKVLENIGYIRLGAFSEDTDDRIEEILEDFEDQTLRGYIVDVRGNPGGLLQQAIAIADYFLDSGTIVTVQNRREENTFSASAYRSITKRPVAILIDNATASSSEILALALSDHDHALLIGEESFGKGTVQTLYSLHEGEGLKLTTARYASPQGTTLMEKGITPDIIIADDPETEPDEQIQAAVANLMR